MADYRATNQDTGEVVEYTADLPQSEHQSAPWRLEEIVMHVVTDVDPPPDTRMFQGRRLLTKNEFVDLLGDVAYQAILTMAHQSVAVESWVKRLELAQADLNGYSVNLDEALTQNGVSAIGMVLESQSVVDSTWAATVLNG